jgi:16S rRNA (guanine966-N2)-methyltransferase
MRIISGLYKRKQIVFPDHIRPTQDKVRQAVFDCMSGLVSGAKVLDLFAGSGAYGLESLSREASLVYFIDSDRKCTMMISKNLGILGLNKEEISYDKTPEVFNYTNDAFRAMGILEKKGVFFDLIFVDPPYCQELAKKALQTLSTGGILSKLGFVIIEHSKKETLCDTQGSLNLVKTISHSDTVISIYQKTGVPSAKK